MDWAALKAVYIAQPTTIAKPASCRVRRSSVRRTCRTLASRGGTASCSKGLNLLDARNPLQLVDPLRDRRMGVEEPAEEAPVVLFGVVDHHRRDGVVEALGWLVVLSDLLQRADQARWIASELDAAHIRKRLTLAGERELHDRPDDERDQRKEDSDGEDHKRRLAAVPAAEAHPAHAVPENARDESRHADHGHHDQKQAHVEVLDVAHLVGEHTLELFPIHHLQKTCRDRYRRVAGIATGGEGIGARIVDDTHLRQGKPVTDRESLHDVVELLVLVRVGFAGAHRGEYRRRAEVIRVEGGADAQERERDRARDRATVSVSKPTDDETDDEPDKQETNDHDHAVALVARDLVVHLGGPLVVAAN